MNTRNGQWIAVTAALVCAAAILTFGWKAVSAKQASRSTGTAAPAATVTRENGRVVIHLSKEAQQNLGLAEERLQPARRGRQTTLPAMVLALGHLQSLVSSYDAASAQLQKAEIIAGVSRQEYQRLKKLFGEEQNVSAKAVQAAEGVYKTNEVDVRLARESLSLADGAVRQSWGEAIAGWVAHDKRSLKRVLRRDEVLVEVTIPMGEAISAPSAIEFDLPAGGEAYARRVSAIPQVDPRVQGVGYLYIAPSDPGLAPGVNLIARFGVGAVRSGVIIPAGAVVWLHGRAWAYIAKGSGRFVRYGVATEIPTSGGWFMAHGFRPGASVVTEDAQQILAVELADGPSSHGSAAGGRR